VCQNVENSIHDHFFSFLSNVENSTQFIFVLIVTNKKYESRNEGCGVQWSRSLAIIRSMIGTYCAIAPSQCISSNQLPFLHKAAHVCANVPPLLFPTSIFPFPFSTSSEEYNWSGAGHSFCELSETLFHLSLFLVLLRNEAVGLE